MQSTLNLLTQKLMTWYEIGIKSLPNFIVAIVILFLFVFFAKTARKISKKLMKRISQSRSVNNLLETIIYLVVLFIGLFTALEIIGLEKTVTSILAGAGVLGLAVGFAFQEIASNFAAGIFIALQEPYKIGDIVEIEGRVGEVTKIELRTTSLTTFQGLEVYIPNKDMFTKALVNFTSTPKRRVDISVGVSYSDNLKLVEQTVKKALEDITGRMKEREVEVFFQNFGESSIDLSARVWITYRGGTEYLQANHEAIMRIKSSFDENNITIPFPIRTLDVGEIQLKGES